MCSSWNGGTNNKETQKTIQFKKKTKQQRDKQVEYLKGMKMYGMNKGILYYILFYNIIAFI